jgi:hypothetical protein
MTRSAKEALSESQLALGERCERMLASRAWQHANVNYFGVERRLELIVEAGLPPMTVVSATTLEELGRIPRSNEGYQVDALSALRAHGPGIVNGSKAVLVFYSHRWKRPMWCPGLNKDVPWGSEDFKSAKELGYAVGDVDGPDHEKARALIEWSKWFKREQAWFREGKIPSGALLGNTYGVPVDADMELYFWIDWPCVDQSNPSPSMAALPAYVAVCSVISAAWSEEYSRRAWCRVELVMAHAFAVAGQKVFVIEEGFRDERQKALKKEIVTLDDPADGALTNDLDRPVINSLTSVAISSRTFSCRVVCCTNSCVSWHFFCFWNLLCCCQCCGLCAWYQSRDVRPGHGTVVTKIAPAHQ